MMPTIDFADTGRRTTRLGFGCSSIMGSMGRRESLQTLQWAFDAGVRHFDVAPAYGYGEAEGCLGEFLSQHREEVTVTTKFGIAPAKNPGLIGIARNLARPLIKAIPALKAKAQRAASVVAAVPAKRDLSIQKAQASLESSLRNLRVDRIDLFLLHDATAGEVRDSPLLGFLENAKQKGSIGAFGVGTDRGHASAILAESPAYARVVQREWSVFDGVEDIDTFKIHHRSLAGNRRRLERYLASEDIAKRWSAATGTDLRAPGVLGELMMRAALGTNPVGIVLFSSKDNAHIRSNALLAEPSAANAKAMELYRLVQAEADQIPTEFTV
ncbi:aldo/keto reductase [Terriglobus roseus]|uniref:Aldo/keto reductase family protein n=1 Tax=Terriglobus roseus TaxID=392734 RepID=A0A1H4JLC1_9BACT|nr:aldo/keto reductase [Terriglobus roseus]SEB46755.1 Aldo/keto reductase family protein [Terriglobus roseus]